MRKKIIKKCYKNKLVKNENENNKKNVIRIK